MNLNVPTRTARLTCGTRRSYQSMNHMIQNASSAIARCKRFIQFLTSNSREAAFTAQTISYAQLWISSARHAINAGVIHILDRAGTLQARALQGAHTAPPKRRARWVAVALVGALCLPMSHASSGSIDAIQSIKELANYQLTDKQYHCHNQITYIESRNDLDAVNGSHNGIYQGRSKALIDAPADYQFYWYWSYVSNRYGITEYDEPDYCKALDHLRVKGWQ